MQLNWYPSRWYPSRVVLFVTYSKLDNDMYPSIALCSPEATVTVNFGQNAFQYSEEHLEKYLENRRSGENDEVRA